MPLPASDLPALSRLLDEALALDDAARAAWLANLPPEHAGLAPILRRLLDEARATQALAHTDPAWKLVDRLATDPKIPQHGERVGPYRLVHELGRGGMATVWLAQRADGLFERDVALKLPHAAFVEPGLAQRVARERAVLASLAHPNIAQLHDAGWSESGRPYLALEFVEGQAIDRWCTDQHLDVRARVRLFVDVVRAVAYAHARLVIHRDLKPANVMVTHDGHAKLLDFGVAKLLEIETGQAHETELTRLAGRPLTPNYAAPEQITGEPISTATDLYSLGVLLYELLVQKSPYRLTTKTRRQLENAVLGQDPVAPSATATDPALQRALRGDLDAIVLKALKKRPEDRYETAAAFADDLERYLGGRAVSAQRDSPWYRLQRFAGRHRAALAWSAAVGCVLAIGVAATAWQATRARDEAAAAAATRDFVLAMIQRADPRSSQLTRAEDRALLLAADERIDVALRSQPALQLRMWVAIATAYRNRGDDEAAARVLRRAIGQTQAAVAGDNLDLLEAQVMLADQMATLAEAARGRKIGTALADLDRTIEVLLKTGDAGTPLLVDAFAAHTTLRAAAESMDHLRAAAELRKTYQFAAEKLGVGNERTLRVARRLALVLAGTPLVDNPAALAVIEPSIAAALGVGAGVPSHPDLIGAQALRARLLCALGRAPEGRALLARTLETARLTHGVRSNVYRAALREAGLANWYLGDMAQALQAAASAYVLLANDQPFASEARASEALALSRHLLVAHRPAEAEPFIEEAETALQAIPDPVERENRAQWVKLRRAWMLFEFGDHAQARRVIEPVLAKATADGNQSVATVARSMRDQAGGWEQRGAYVGAPNLPAERRIAEVLRRHALADVPEGAGR